MVVNRPHTAQLSWISGGNYDSGNYSGGTPETLDVKCRIVEIVGEITVQDGRKMTVSYKVYIDSINLSGINQETLRITFNGITRKVIRASTRQTHVKLWL